MNLVTSIEFLAVVVSAIYGILLASRNEMDVVGVFAVAFLAAFGGGTLRDLFLDRQPLFWIGNAHYPVVVFVMSIAAIWVIRFLPRIKPFLIFPDAVGMGLFTVAGTAIALDSGTSWFIAAMLGTITGTFGGVLADIVCNHVPSLFRPAPLCATCSFTGAWGYIGCCYFEVPEAWSLAIGATLVVLLRLAAVRWNWQFKALRSLIWVEGILASSNCVRNGCWLGLPGNRIVPPP